EQCPLLEGLPEQFPAALYHSWRLAAFPWPAELMVTARDSGKNVQAIRHRHLPLYGIQFHPESILTPDGEALLRNFLSLPAGSREKRRIKMIPSQPPATGMNGTRPESVSLPCGSGSHTRPLQR
ncbi:MAG: glutamine amidotransferase-related protein, partial [Akkermansia muciniphila]